jgi:hypothetical protein
VRFDVAKDGPNRAGPFAGILSAQADNKWEAATTLHYGQGIQLAACVGEGTKL